MKALFLMVGLLAACNDSSPAPNAGADMAVAPSSPDLASGCITNPTTSVEILNACTTADSVDKMPFYPTRAPNGQLPDLQ